MFGLLNELDTKQFDDLNESFNKTEPSDMKVDEIFKENGMKGYH
jgi:hypothetical protein